MTRKRVRGMIAVLTLGAAVSLATGCGDDNKDTSSAPPSVTTTEATPSDTAGSVSVEASEMKFVLTSDSAPAGEVTFDAKNVGKVDHEMVVIKTDADAAGLPVKDGEVDEAGSIGEIGPEDLKPGASSSLTLDMAAGHYVLICALPGHYEAGMRSNFTVK